MNIGVIGSGDVGKSFARGFAARGHQVTIGSREPEKLADFIAGISGVRSAGNEEAARFGELLVVATAYDGTKNALELAGVRNFDGKPVIDATNPLTVAGGKLSLSLGFNTSAGEEIQRLLSGARVVKAFNTVGHGYFANPELPHGPPTMFYCGNDDRAKQTVADVIRSFGREAVDAGGIEASRYLEPMAMLWITIAMRESSRGHAFKLLREANP